MQIRMRNDAGRYGSVPAFLADVSAIPRAFDAFFAANPSADPRDGLLQSLAHHLRRALTAHLPHASRTPLMRLHAPGEALTAPCSISVP